jgi:hypothetical protein
MSASAPRFRAVVKADGGVRAAGERALDRPVLLLDVLAQNRDRGTADGPAKYEPDHKRCSRR